MNPRALIPVALAALLCGCWITVRPNVVIPAVDVITPGHTNSIPVSSIQTFVEGVCVAGGYPAAAGAAGVAVGLAFTLWKMWYNRKVKALKAQVHGEYKLGKMPQTIDPRTMKMSAMLDDILPPIPDGAFDLDKEYPIDYPMFANDTHGDCVIAGRGHFTRRCEYDETGKVINIKDEDILAEYFKETGGEDSGLNMLVSLQAWRNGWTVNGKPYKIDAYGILDGKNWQSIRTGLYLLRRLYCGVELPDSARSQTGDGKVWDVVAYAWWKPSGAAGSWGGHCVMMLPIIEENGDGWVITWGKKQRVSRKFLQKYFSEIYGVVDSLNSWGKKKKGYNPEKMTAYLNQLRKAA
jgi:hypothetical protein